MTKNLVIFGPAHGGKSTLAGFIRANEAPGEFRKQVGEFHRSLPGIFRETDKYRLLLDKHHEERKRQAEPGHGTSWYMHTTQTRIGGSDFLLIDTPGREHERSRREMLRGLFYGDIAILLLEIAWFQEEEEERLFDDFSQLAVWLNFGYRRDAVIVVVSKMDTVNFSQAKFQDARTISETLIKDASAELYPVPFQIVPTAIDFDHEVGHNVLERTDAMNWFDGPTLAETIKVFSSRTTITAARQKDESLVVCIRKIYDLPNAKPQGLVIEGKVMSGSMNAGAQIKIAPTQLAGNEWVPLTATVAELRELGKDTGVSICRAGDMISANCTDLKVHKRTVETDDLSISSSSVIVGENTPCDVGSILVLETAPINLREPTLLEHIILLWFGRTLSAQIIALDCDGGKFHLELRHDKRTGSAERGRVGVALDQAGSAQHREFLIRHDRGGGLQDSSGLRKPVYFPVRLERVGRPCSLTYTPLDLETRIASTQLTGTFHSRSTDTNVVFEGISSYAPLLHELRNLERRRLPDSLSKRISIVLQEPERM